jgi:hypothetical protein
MQWSHESSRLKREEIRQQFLSFDRQNRFGMKLHAVQREFAMA